MMTFSGYFPKRVTPRPPDYDLPNVLEIASVSTCIAKAPEKWITNWTFNELGLFDDAALAEAVVPESERSTFDIYAYSLLNERFDAGVRQPWALPALAPTPVTDDFERLGFDAVSKSQSSFFECSPLSCNGEARRLGANAYCLFDSMDDAVAAATEFSKGGAEPGPYYVAEVFRRRRPTRR